MALGVMVVAIAAFFALSRAQVTSTNSSSTSQRTILEITPSDYVRGSQGAPVIIYEFGDFQCPSCGYWFKTQEQQIITKLIQTNQAKLVWKDFAYYGPDSTSAAEATYAAGEQGKFWAFHDLLYSNQGTPNSGWADIANLRRFAQSLGLNMTQFNESISSGKFLPVIQQNYKLGQALGMQGTPTFFLVGPTGKVVKIEGGQPVSVFENEVSSLLKG